MDATVDALVHLGYTALFLWVLDANGRAKRFYESYGFQYNGIHQEIRIGQKTYTELAYTLCIAAECN